MPLISVEMISTLHQETTSIHQSCPSSSSYNIPFECTRSFFHDDSFRWRLLSNPSQSVSFVGAEVMEAFHCSQQRIMDLQNLLHLLRAQGNYLRSETGSSLSTFVSQYSVDCHLLHDY